MTIEELKADANDSRVSSSFFNLSFEQMVENEVYKDPQSLFDWSKTITERVKCDGNHTALTVKKYLSGVEDSDTIFDSVIKYAGEIGIKSEVQTNDKGYTVAVLVSMYLDSQGLGYDKKVKT